jgi:hypothetical protein
VSFGVGGHLSQEGQSARGAAEDESPISGLYDIQHVLRRKVNAGAQVERHVRRRQRPRAYIAPAQKHPSTQQHKKERPEE